MLIRQSNFYCWILLMQRFLLPFTLNSALIHSLDNTQYACWGNMWPKQVWIGYRYVSMYDLWKGSSICVKGGQEKTIIWCMDLVMWVMMFVRFGVRGYRWDTMSGYAQQRSSLSWYCLFLNSKSFSTFLCPTATILMIIWWANWNSSPPNSDKKTFEVSVQLNNKHWTRQED